MEKVKNNEHFPVWCSTVKLSLHTLDTWIPKINFQNYQFELNLHFLIINNNISKFESCFFKKKNKFTFQMSPKLFSSKDLKSGLDIKYSGFYDYVKSANCVHIVRFYGFMENVKLWKKRFEIQKHKNFVSL